MGDGAVSSADLISEPLDLGQLRGFYRESLSCQRNALVAAYIELQHGQLEAVTVVRRLAHALCGLGVDLGLPDLSKAAVAVEREGKVPTAASLDTLIHLLDRVIGDTPAARIPILIVEADPDNAALLEVVLSTSNREILIAHTVAEAETLLEAYPVALIVLEIDLPDTDGRDLLVRLRARMRTALTPILVLSERSSPQVKLECLALGADAFYEKPFDTAALSSVISARLQRRASIESKDPLTGLPDRVAFLEAYDRVGSFYSSRAPTRRRHALAILDFDHLQALNEVHGHAVGDAVLRRATALIAQSIRDADFLARWEGQQFVILFPNTQVAEAAAVLDRALQAVRQEPFRGAREENFRLSFSAGLVDVNPPADTLEATLTRAQLYLQAAKHNGRARIEITEDTPAPVKTTVLLVEDDPLIAGIMKSRLAQEDFNVVHKDNGAAAYAWVQEHVASVVLLDIRLPGMDGFELLERLRRMPAYVHVPVVMLTAMANEQDVARGFELGADDYVLKPFSLRELVARVRRLLQRNRTTAPLLPELA